MKIGNVILDLDFYNENLSYSDGDVEETLLEIVKNSDNYTAALLETDNWAILYHLHKDRENILSWYPFTGKEDVLEIGAGCGAITGLLAEKCGSVTCNDISLRRSQINAYKNAKHDNIKILVGNFTDIKLEEKFDVITLIGVLEYAASYMGTEHPYQDMLKKVKGMLKPDGKLMIAIENKFGLKYWAGCAEDHTGRLFEGIEGYPHTKEIRTFSKKELCSMLKEVGFAAHDFYYPLPDYKFPKVIYSEERLPNYGEIGNVVHNYDMERLKLFDETAVYNQLIKEDMFDFFANSFLIIASI
ncbi:MAG: class I SAM-dependent methyltransferase [Christensenellaceae bacterium]